MQRYKTLEAIFKSPFKIGNSGDYFQVDIELNKKTCKQSHEAPIGSKKG